jgi:tryptophan-rich sensory protein
MLLTQSSAVVRKSFDRNSALCSLGVRIMRIALNAAWSWMFFGVNSTLLGVLNIIPQLLIIIASVGEFARVSTSFYLPGRPAPWSSLFPMTEQAAPWVASQGL